MLGIGTQNGQSLLSLPHLMSSPPEVGMSSALCGTLCRTAHQPCPLLGLSGWREVLPKARINRIAGSLVPPLDRLDLAGIVSPALTGCVTLGESFSISDTHLVFLSENHTGYAGHTQVSTGCNCLLSLCVTSPGVNSPLDRGPQP